MAVLKNRAKMSTSTTGTGTITLGSAEDGYQTFADAGVADADVVRYVIEDGSNFEIGTGTYTASGTTLTRTVSESSNSDAAINLSGSATVFIGATAEDIPALYADNPSSATTPTASGANAIAIGDNTTASGEDAVAIGDNIVASGLRSISLGGFSDATGDYSVALGAGAQALGENAVAIKGNANYQRTTAIGMNGGGSKSIAGVVGTSTGGATALSGSYAGALDSFAAAIANNTSSYGATGNNSIAIGKQAKATATNSYAIGYFNSATGIYGTVVGGAGSSATGSNSTVIGGFTNVASATGSTVLGGQYNDATGAESLVGGYSSTASHSNSIVFGDTASSSAANEITLGSTSDTVRISSAYTLPTSDGTNGQVLTTDGSGAVTFADAGGGGASAYTFNNQTLDYTVVSSDLGKIISFTGGGSKTATLTSAATLGAGWYCFITSDKSTGGLIIDPDGSETIEAASTFPIKRGQRVQIVSDGTNWFVSDSTFPRGISFDNANNSSQANASGSGAVALGYGSTASGGYTFAAGASSSAAGAVAGTGGGAVALGGSRASGADSFAAAIATNSSSYGATATSSIAMGKNAKATGANAVSFSGENATASGSKSFAAGGEYQTASGAFAVSLGGSVNTASGEASYAFGKRALASEVGKYAYGAQLVSTAGATQGGMMVLISATTDATPRKMGSNNSAGTYNNQLLLPNNSAYAFHGTIVARQQAADGTACAAWKVEGLIRREANAGTTVLVNSATTVLDNTPNWGMALSADTTNGGLAITVTGAASTNIRWVATIHTSEVTYA